jgi:glycosyltransferase involved in cell wall biosynthesis
MGAANPASGKPLVSVIVPARNEEASLGTCLESLAAQTGVDFEIIVVDDGSTDRTRQIAESFRDVRVVDAPPLPAGWTGKNNAVTAGARHATGHWLLFTDADTVHLPGSLARSVKEAQDRDVSLLSYSPEQEVRTFWEKAVMPLIFGELASTYSLSKVNDLTSSVAAANGQYLLILHDAYDAVGGHTKIAYDLLEDVALARAVKSSNRKIFFRYGADAVRTRMYRSFAQLREGWTKNLAALFPHSIQLAIMLFIDFWVIFSMTVGLIQSTFFSGYYFSSIDLAYSNTHIPEKMVLISKYWMIVCPAFILVFFLLKNRRRVVNANFPWTMTFVTTVGLPIVAYLLLRSRLSYRYGRVAWKGRSYGMQQ